MLGPPAPAVREQVDEQQPAAVLGQAAVDHPGGARAVAGLLRAGGCGEPSRTPTAMPSAPTSTSSSRGPPPCRSAFVTTSLTSSDAVSTRSAMAGAEERAVTTRRAADPPPAASTAGRPARPCERLRSQPAARPRSRRRRAAVDAQARARPCRRRASCRGPSPAARARTPLGVGRACRAKPAASRSRPAPTGTSRSSTSPSVNSSSVAARRGLDRALRVRAALGPVGSSAAGRPAADRARRRRTRGAVVAQPQRRRVPGGGEGHRAVARVVHADEAGDQVLALEHLGEAPRGARARRAGSRPSTA